MKWNSEEQRCSSTEALIRYNFDNYVSFSLLLSLSLYISFPAYLIKLKDNDDCKEGKTKWNKESVGIEISSGFVYVEIKSLLWILDFRVLKDEIDLGDSNRGSVGF